MTHHINNLKENYTSLVENAREKYLLSQSQSLSHPGTGTKTYWSILKNFLNKNKFPIIPPLFHLNKFITEFQEKATSFNNFFARQCIVLETGQLPSFCATTDSILENILFSDDDIITQMRCPNPNKAHGWDSITIHMIQICDDTLVTPLSIIYTNCIKKGVFPKPWKRANVVPVYKKDCKQLMKNYRPILWDCWQWTLGLGLVMLYYFITLLKQRTYFFRYLSFLFSTKYLKRFCSITYTPISLLIT